MNILFLCVANSARSQMAEGIAKSILSSNHDIRSAGSLPGEEVHPGAIKSLNEVGIDISNNVPKSIKSLDKSFIDKLDFVILLCAEEECPLPPKSMNILNWHQPDPVIKLNNFNNVRCKIIKLLNDFNSKIV
jgi:arsenate reductase (thioredoxin)